MESLTRTERRGVVAAAAICLLFVNVTLASAQSYRLSGSVDGTAQFGVDDAIDVYLNGVKIYGDPAAASSGNRGPIPLPGATVGAEVRFDIRDTYGDCRALRRVILTDTATGRFTIAHPGWDGGCGHAPDPGVVYQATFTIPELQPLPAYSEVPLPGSSLSGLVPGTDGRLYGVTYSGGAYGWGTLFALDPVTQQIAVLHEFSNGLDGGAPYHNLTLDSSTGKFYGTTSERAGTIFSFDPVTNTLTTLIAEFGGRSVPQQQLVLVGNHLFGMLAYFPPAVFRVRTDGTGFTVLHDFEYFSARPQQLTRGSDGKLYGGVPFEGVECDPNRPGQACGIAFRMNAVTDDSDPGFEVLHRFQYYYADPCPAGDLNCVSTRGLPNSMNYPQKIFLGSDGMAYGHTYFSVFRFDPDAPATTMQYLWTEGGGIMTTVIEGADGRLYATGYGGGPAGGGIVLSMNKDGSDKHVLHTFDFRTGTTSYGPYGPLFRNAAGTIFGLTEYTDAASPYYGVAYIINPDGASGTNQPPVADPQSVTVPEDTPTAITLTGGDPEGAAITFELVTNPVNGTLTGIIPNLTYTPAAEFSGNDSFTFKVRDGAQDSAIETISITVTPVNDPPVAVDDPGFTTAEDTELQIQAATLLANDSDIDGGALSVAFVSNPVNGVVILNAGAITFTPAANFAGSASFEYTVSDGNGGTDTGLVTIAVTGVNDAPRASEDSYSTDEDTPVTVAAPGVLGNDNDPDGDSITAVLNSNPLPQQGSLTLNPDGSFTFTPAPNTSGQVTFTYKATDGTLESFVTTVRITVNPVNDPPVAANDAVTVAEDSGANAIAVLANDADPDGQAVSVIAVTQGAHGSVTFTAAGASYTPNLNFYGNDSFTYTISDGQGGTATATVSVTVTPVNDPPVASGDAYSVLQGAVLNVAAPGVLQNDTDVDNASLAAALATSPANGTVSLNADGSFSYTPNAAFSGIDSFTYRASDGSAQTSPVTVTLTVTPAPAVPAAPSRLTTTAVGTTLVNLEWTDNANNEDGVVIERCQGNGNCTSFVPVGTVGANVTTYSDTGLTPGTAYSYRVRAFNAFGNSAYSNIRKERTKK